jgi:hypothetical protein
MTIPTASIRRGARYFDVALAGRVPTTRAPPLKAWPRCTTDWWPWGVMSPSHRGPSAPSAPGVLTLAYVRVQVMGWSGSEVYRHWWPVRTRSWR